MADARYVVTYLRDKQGLILIGDPGLFFIGCIT